MDDSHSHDSVRPKQRRRPALACEQCRRRKVRCDRSYPCNHCLRSNPQNCTYAAPHVPKVSAKAESHKRGEPDVPLNHAATFTSANEAHADHRALTPLSASGLVSASTAASSSSAVGPLALDYAALSNQNSVSAPHHEMSLKSLQERIIQLEKSLALGEGFQHTPVEATSSNLEDEQTFEQVTDKVIKTHYFGPSHWMNGIELFSKEIGLIVKNQGTGNHNLSHHMKEGKRLSKILKRRTDPNLPASLAEDIPSKELADQLVQLYLTTFEGVFRILHIPSFRNDYHIYWNDPSATGVAFTIQMKLVMALGASLYDETFSLRTLATRWVHEAQVWTALPPEKAQVTIGGLQTLCLLILAKQACSVDGDLVWSMTGTLVRRAMAMGLHRDPRFLAPMPLIRAEMRRRLWGTIIELNLQSALDAGGSPLLSTKDFDTQPPANFDDAQLEDRHEVEADGPKEPSVEVPTDTSVQLALRKSFAVRTAVVKHVNELRGSRSYDGTLRLNSELTTACRILSRTLPELASKQSRAIITEFHINMAELLVYRGFHALHQPFMIRSLRDPKFFFSRKMALDCALKILDICSVVKYPDGSRGVGGDSQPTRAETSYFHRLTINGGGVFRNLPFQAMVAVALEYLEKNDVETLGLGYLPSKGDSDLQLVLESALSWLVERLRSGDTNTKGFIVLRARLGHAKALEKGLNVEGVEATILKYASSASEMANAALLECVGGEELSVKETQTSPQSANPAAELAMGGSMDWIMDQWPWHGDDGTVWGHIMDNMDGATETDWGMAMMAGTFGGIPP